MRIADRYRGDQVERACDTIVRTVPAVSTLRPSEVCSQVRASRWDLAVLIAERGRLDAFRKGAVRAAAPLDGDDSLRKELAGQSASLAASVESLEAEVVRRLDRLTALAARAAAIVRADQVKRRAWRVLAPTDAGLLDSATLANRPDPGADFAERTGAVLAAYEELTAGRARQSG